MNDLTRDEIVRALQRQYKISPKRAAEMVERRFPPGQAATASVPTSAPAPPKRVPLPFDLRIPWSHLVSDDARYGVMSGRPSAMDIATSAARATPRMILKPEYRAAKEKIRKLARDQLGTVDPLAFPLALHARVWIPDDIRAHDVPNFAKLVHDSLEGVVYINDRWLWDARWTRMGVDVDAPRAEVRITLHVTAMSEAG